MNARLSGFLTLAWDVPHQAMRRRTFWVFLALGTLVGAGAGLGVDVAAVMSHEPDVLPWTLPAAPVRPGSVTAYDGRRRTWIDDGEGHLRDRARAVDPGGELPGDRTPGAVTATVDYATGAVALAPGASAAPLGSNVHVSYAVAFRAGAPLPPGAYECRLYVYGEVFNDGVASLLVLTFLMVTLVHGGMASMLGVILGLVATADAVSSAFEPGTAELVLPRPVRRYEVVLARFLGGLLFGAIQLFWVIGLLVVLVGARLGIWLPELVLLAGPVLLKFAVLLSLCSLVAVVSRTQALGLAAAAGAWIASTAVNFLVEDATRALAQNGLGGAPGAAAALHGKLLWAQRLLPQVAHQDALAKHLCGLDPDVTHFSAGLVAVQGLAWVALPLLVACLVVSRRDC